MGRSGFKGGVEAAPGRRAQGEMMPGMGGGGPSAAQMAVAAGGASPFGIGMMGMGGGGAEPMSQGGSKGGVEAAPGRRAQGEMMPGMGGGGAAQAAGTLNQAAPPGERVAFVNPMEETMLKAAGGSGRPSSGGVPSYKKGDVEAPPEVDYGAKMWDTFMAQKNIMGPMAEEERKWGSYMSENELMKLRTLLMGTEDTPGLLSTYEGDVDPALRRMAAAQQMSKVSGDVSAMEEFGPAMREAIRAQDPDRAALMDAMMGQAQEGMELGAQLSPYEQRQVSQGTRSGQAARGMGYGPRDVAYENIAQLETGRAEKQRRFAQGAQAAGLSQALYGDPFMQVLGRSSGMSPMAAAGIGGQAAGMAPGRLFNPESQTAFGVYNQNAQRLLAANTASAANRSAMTTGAMGMAGDMIPWCHVAREVFGEGNSQWVAFFVWKEFRGPRWFRKLYNRFSEPVARFIRNKPRVKKLIRNWMEEKINGIR